MVWISPCIFIWAALLHIFKRRSLGSHFKKKQKQNKQNMGKRPSIPLLFLLTLTLSNFKTSSCLPPPHLNISHLDLQTTTPPPHLNISHLDIRTISYNDCLPSYPNAGITSIMKQIAERPINPLIPCDMYNIHNYTKHNCSFFKTHHPSIPGAWPCPNFTHVKCALIRPVEDVILSRKHFFNLIGKSKEPNKQFVPVLHNFLVFVRYWNEQNLLCSVSEHDWSFSNKLLEIANGYEERRKAIQAERREEKKRRKIEEKKKRRGGQREKKRVGYRG